MITGVHAIVYTKDAEGVRAFFRDVFGFPSVDAGEGWLIFGLPPAELAAHPTEGPRSPRALPRVCRRARDRRGAEGQGRRPGAPRARRGFRSVDRDPPAGRRRDRPVRAETREPTHAIRIGRAGLADRPVAACECTPPAVSCLDRRRGVRQHGARWQLEDMGEQQRAINRVRNGPRARRDRPAGDPSRVQLSPIGRRLAAR